LLQNGFFGFFLWIVKPVAMCWKRFIQWQNTPTPLPQSRTWSRFSAASVTGFLLWPCEETCETTVV
jgi:hypothetical protein